MICEACCHMAKRDEHQLQSVVRVCFNSILSAPGQSNCSTPDPVVNTTPNVWQSNRSDIDFAMNETHDLSLESESETNELSCVYQCDFRIATAAVCGCEQVGRGAIGPILSNTRKITDVEKFGCKCTERVGRHRQTEAI